MTSLGMMPLTINSLASSKFQGRRIHFVGAGGCGMSGLARILIDSGAIVTGSEPNPSDQTLDLIRRGAKISREQNGQLLSADVDMVVRTAAIKPENFELAVARKLGLAQFKYAELLGQVMAERTGIAVAGTHGKSTTSAMISYALLECGADPSFVIGGTVPQLGGVGSRSGAGNLFVAEACEFDRSFHHFRPKVSLITNIEEDHLDYYRDLDEIIESFYTFANLVSDGGLVIASGSDRNVAKALLGVKARIELVSIGGEHSWSVAPLGLDNGCPVGLVRYMGRPRGTLKLALPGQHNLINATMAVAACEACGIPPEQSIPAISRFTGVDRRMSVMGQVNGATIIDDYGHHPTEIRATLAALRERYKPRKLYCIFQPHQHSRTRFLLDDFARSFAEADVTIVPDIYFVRDSEQERQSVSAQDLVSRIEEQGARALYLQSFGAIVSHVKPLLGDGDLVVTMGAGNVWEIGRDLVG